MHNLEPQRKQPVRLLHVLTCPCLTAVQLSCSAAQRPGELTLRLQASGRKLKEVLIPKHVMCCSGGQEHTPKPGSKVAAEGSWQARLALSDAGSDSCLIPSHKIDFLTTPHTSGWCSKCQVVRPVQLQQPSSCVEVVRHAWIHSRHCRPASSTHVTRPSGQTQGGSYGTSHCCATFTCGKIHLMTYPCVTCF